MHNKIFITCLLLILISVFGKSQDLSRKGVFDALVTEVDRNFSKLNDNGKLRPYYISCAVNHTKFFRIDATEKTEEEEFFRDDINRYTLDCDLRIGDYALDNSNSGVNISYQNKFNIDQMYGFSDRDITNLADKIWLELDALYTSAIAGYSSKLEKREHSTIPDFNRLDARIKLDTTLIDTIEIDTKIKLSAYLDDIKNALKVYEKDSLRFNTELSIVTNTFYFYDTEGSKIIETKNYGILNISRINSEFRSYFQVSPSEYKKLFTTDELPPIEAIIAYAEQLKQGLTKKEPSAIIEPYFGSVFFEGNAVAQVIFKSINSNNRSFSSTRSDDKDRWSFNKKDNIFEKKKGFRAFSPDMQLTAYSITEQYRGKSLLGSFEYDNYGVKAVDSVNLVKNGKVNELLNSRAPTKYVKNSRGFGRGNLNLLNRNTNSFILAGTYHLNFRNDINYDSLKNMFFENLISEGQTKGYIVKELDNQRFYYTSNPEPDIEGLLIYEVDLITREEKFIENAALDYISDISLLQIIGCGKCQENIYEFLPSRNESLIVSFIHPTALLLPEVTVKNGTQQRSPSKKLSDVTPPPEE